MLEKKKKNETKDEIEIKKIEKIFFAVHVLYPVPLLAGQNVRQSGYERREVTLSCYKTRMSC
jgi:hypothetical protein